MARPRVIDRQRLLDAAERVATASGAANLSFGGIAAEAGVPKASVQSAFGSKEGLIEAMLERWLTGERQRFERAAGANPTAHDRIRAHIRTIREEPPDESSRMATLMATLAGSGEQIESAARWYAERIGDLSARSADERRLRIAFLAAEGAYYIRHLVGFEMSDEVWESVFEDLTDFVAPPRA